MYMCMCGCVKKRALCKYPQNGFMLSTKQKKYDNQTEKERKKQNKK